MNRLLGWFSEDEREQCPLCGERAAVGKPSLLMVCLGCGGVWKPGETLGQA